GPAATRLGPGFEVPQLHAEHRALDAVHPVVESLHRVLVALLLAPAAQRPNPPRQVAVVGDHRATFAVGAEVLPRIETEASQLAHRSASASAVLRSVRLAGVFDHRQTVLPRDG